MCIRDRIWYFLIMGFFALAPYQTFLTNSLDYLLTMECFNRDASGFLLTVLYLFSGMLTLLTGVCVVDKQRQYMWPYFSALFAGVTAFGLMSLAKGSPDCEKWWALYLPFFMVMAYNALIETWFWSALSSLLREEVQGTTYGAIRSSINAGVTMFTFCAAVLYEKDVEQHNHNEAESTFDEEEPVSSPNLHHSSLTFYVGSLLIAIGILVRIKYAKGSEEEQSLDPGQRKAFELTNPLNSH
eukprot:TRINITY_DN19694_c0_g1_i1.p1 TRINITY_DN19694_c0_g1~~TRINITY_DN19694_c0_g1_i1.p1  ORF type:complete len:260 (-),score=27.94 TRINITY_DN19694_c0_g1_i1:117-839(-)